MHSPLLAKYLHELQVSGSYLPILDLACGSGRNGLFCLQHNLPVTFADINGQSLTALQQALKSEQTGLNYNLASFWQVDFEQTAPQLKENTFSAVMVFRYLHRALLEQIKASVIPNGLVIYETFTVEQADLGRPKNPAFLLNKGELASYFADWQILHNFEGIKTSDTGGNKQAVAQIIARKPSR